MVIWLGWLWPGDHCCLQEALIEFFGEDGGGGGRLEKELL